KEVSIGYLGAAARTAVNNNLFYRAWYVSTHWSDIKKKGPPGGTATPMAVVVPDPHAPSIGAALEQAVPPYHSIKSFQRSFDVLRHRAFRRSGAEFFAGQEGAFDTGMFFFNWLLHVPGGSALADTATDVKPSARPPVANEPIAPSAGN